MNEIVCTLWRECTRHQRKGIRTIERSWLIDEVIFDKPLRLSELKFGFLRMDGMLRPGYFT